MTIIKLSKIKLLKKAPESVPEFPHPNYWVINDGEDPHDSQAAGKMDYQLYIAAKETEKSEREAWNAQAPHRMQLFRIQEAEKKILEAKAIIADAEDKLKSSAPFQPGDKVRVTEVYNGAVTDVYIRSVYIGHDGNFGYGFWKTKADGSASRHRWAADDRIDTIEKL